MFYQHLQHKQFHQFLPRVKCRVVLGCMAVGYVLWVAAIMVLSSATSSPTSQQLYKDSDNNFDAEVVQQKPSRVFKEVFSIEQLNGNHVMRTIAEQPNVKQLVDSNVNQPEWKQLNRKQANVKHSNMNNHNSVIHETFTAYQFDDNDAAVNTIPKPQVEHKRNRKQAVIMGHRKVKRRRLWYNTPPIVTNLDGNTVTGLASY